MSELSKLSDDALMLLYAKGDKQAAAVLTDRLAPRCVAFAARMLKGDTAEAEDVTQEAMMRLWKQAAKWEAGGAAKPGTWLLKVAGNLCIDRLRKTRPDPMADGFDPADPRDSAVDVMIQAERISALDAGLATLPDRQRQAVVLRHIEGWSNPEIAATLEVSVEAAESLTARGKRALAAALAPRKKELSHE